MPTYDYICESCGYEFEQFQTITSRPLRRCPECGENGLKRLIGLGSGVIFKGSGFYQTDYRSENYKTGKKSEKATTEATKKQTTDKPKGSKPDKKTKSA